MRIRPAHKLAQKRDEKPGTTRTAKTAKPRTPLPEHVVPPAPRHLPMPPAPVRPTRQPRRIPGKGGR
ncbi:hypothetical protein [Streptosporangium sp. NPDC048865]|uniref:hypothetical protein n=1 Tax=Streptosporangium sp. NPDC048865 TaxID=3155766 RepID=UPI00341A805F